MQQRRLAMFGAAAILLASAASVLPRQQQLHERQADATLPTPAPRMPQRVQPLPAPVPYVQVATREVNRNTNPSPCSFDRRPRLCGRSGEVPVSRAGEEPTQAKQATLTTPSPTSAADGPAPELPLTEQERLLVRIAQGSRPRQQLASFRRFTVHLRPDEEGPDFQTFFEPYTTPLTQGDPQ